MHGPLWAQLFLSSSIFLSLFFIIILRPNLPPFRFPVDPERQLLVDPVSTATYASVCSLVRNTCWHVRVRVVRRGPRGRGGWQNGQCGWRPVGEGMLDYFCPSRFRARHLDWRIQAAVCSERGAATWMQTGCNDDGRSPSFPVV